MKLDAHRLEEFDSAALLGIAITPLAAFYFQFALGELPCAFCNLIRVGFMIFGSGLLLNLRFGAQA
ncbi:disulfide bond formation protein B [Paraburkholderia azotifigens]|uniref:Disulfide bond formation protein B n=1 Tax=Paraburkholderia azotifigens TaxID=2057004 RepID=A0ABU9RGS6_9BURK